MTGDLGILSPIRTSPLGDLLSEGEVIFFSLLFLFFFFLDQRVEILSEVIDLCVRRCSVSNEGQYHNKIDVIENY